MKKTILLLGCILLIVFLTSCDGRNSDISNDQVRYVIYSYFSDIEENANNATSGNIAFESADKKVFSFSSRTEINRPADADEKYTLELNGKSYSLYYDKSYETAISKSKDHKAYGQFNAYESDKISAYTRFSTNDLLLFANFDENVCTAKGDLTEEEARGIADSALLSLYGETTKQEYSYETAVFTDTRLGTHYTVVYRKFVWDVPTNDSIQITVNMNGEIIGVNAKHFGMFSSSESQVSSEELQNAISVIKEKYSEKWTIGTMQLVLDSEGDYYIYAQLSRTATEEAVEIYINVK